jgi:hypothetical protein
VNAYRPLYDPLTGQMVLGRYRPPSQTMTIGAYPQQAPPADPPPESFTLDDIHNALKRVTPSLLLIGIATGAAFAIGAGLVSRLIFNERR